MLASAVLRAARRRDTGRRVGLGAFAGLLVAIGFLAPSLWFFALFAPLPLLRALAPSAPASAASPAFDGEPTATAALLAGWSAGAVASGLGFFFLAPMLRHGVGWPLSLGFWALFALIQGLPWAAHGLGTWVGVRGGLPLSLSFALAHLVSALVPTPTPWSLAGVVTDRVELLQAAEFGGAPAATLLLLAAGIAAHELWSGRRRGALLWLLFFLLNASLGALRCGQIEQRAATAARWEVGLVGTTTAVGQAEAAVEGFLFLKRAQQSLKGAQQSLTLPTPQLIVWPESALPFPVEETRMGVEIEAQLGEWPAIPLLLGATVVDREGEEHNSALLLKKQKSLGRHDKKVLLPLAETLPRGFSWARGLAPWASERHPGGPDTGMSMDRSVLQVCLCSECLHADTVRAGATDEASLLFDLSNDGWFEGAAAARMHAGLVRLRAIEHRRFLLRAANCGQTGVVSPAGRWETKTSSAGAFVASVAPLAGRTFYARLGDFPSWFALLVLFGSWLRRCVTGTATAT